MKGRGWEDRAVGRKCCESAGKGKREMGLRRGFEETRLRARRAGCLSWRGGELGERDGSEPFITNRGKSLSVPIFGSHEHS